ncbi:MAG: hypothetical protein SNJ74_02025 [Fimbriimonadaceae bacterium]
MDHDPKSVGPLESFFREAVHESLVHRLGLPDAEDLENYLARLLGTFLHNEAIFAIRDCHGRRVETIAEMLAEGDVRLNADSFERERAVHRHLGDFLLFWSGIFPESLGRINGLGGSTPVEGAIVLGRYSYSVVGSFDHPPFDREAPTFQKLSQWFEACRDGLTMVRQRFSGLPMLPDTGNA